MKLPYRKQWSDRWIATAPDGRPYVRGTDRTVAEVQAAWREPSVSAAELRRTFPDLSESQLGAAVIWTPPRTPLHSYIADWRGPPRRRLYIWSEETSGWMIAVSEFDANDDEVPFEDNWAESREEILTYPERYGSRDMIWHDSETGLVVDIYARKD